MAAAWNLHGGEKPECLIPIPLHPARLREREFNQAELLGETIQCVLEVGLEKHILVRARKTASQTKLSSDERKKNIEGCFAIGAVSLMPKSVLLIDDVCTTGATLCEAARMLKCHGVESVSALVFAHG
ncbi:MAG: phosphoribosyltransferase family protein [Patescibacteria group bacterium]